MSQAMLAGVGCDCRHIHSKHVVETGEVEVLQRHSRSATDIHDRGQGAGEGKQPKGSERSFSVSRVVPEMPKGRHGGEYRDTEEDGEQRDPGVGEDDGGLPAADDRERQEGGIG